MQGMVFNQMRSKTKVIPGGTLSLNPKVCVVAMQFCPRMILLLTSSMQAPPQLASLQACLVACRTTPTGHSMAPPPVRPRATTAIGFLSERCSHSNGEWCHFVAMFP